ncbi:hypothetical protein [Cohnella sp. GCM10012308]|uniref:hypothetical protein n=1 Tax=Cohnella sp. GCM10012308 TaxID=3317329 RepID=UPI0036221E36
MSSSTDKPRDLEADLMLCAEASTLTMESHNPVGRLVRYASEAVTGWPYAIRRAKKAEDANDRLREEVAMLHEQLQQQHRSHCFD